MRAQGTMDRLILYDEALARDLVKLIRREGGPEIAKAFVKDVAVLRGRLEGTQGEEREVLLLESEARNAVFLTQIAETLGVVERTL